MRIPEDAKAVGTKFANTVSNNQLPNPFRIEGPTGDDQLPRFYFIVSPTRGNITIETGEEKHLEELARYQMVRIIWGEDKITASIELLPSLFTAVSQNWEGY